MARINVSDFNRRHPRAMKDSAIYAMRHGDRVLFLSRGTGKMFHSCDVRDIAIRAKRP